MKELHNHKIAAVLLSGGLSTRMGQDKAMLHPYGESKPNLLARTHGILSYHFNEIWVSCAENNARLGYECIFDKFPKIGPISGIFAGISQAKQKELEAIMVLPCDLPLVDDSVILSLLKARKEHRAATNGPYNLITTFLHEKTKNIEALIAIYEVESLALFEQAIVSGIRAPRLVIEESLRTTISYTDDMAQSFFNLNTAAEFVEFKKKYAK